MRPGGSEPARIILHPVEDCYLNPAHVFATVQVDHVVTPLVIAEDADTARESAHWTIIVASYG